MEKVNAKTFYEDYRVDEISDDKQENYLKIQKRFPNMPSMCIAIICELAKRQHFNAVEFAKSFESIIDNDESNVKESLNSEKNQKYQKMMRTIRKYTKSNKLDREVVEKIVIEKKTPIEIEKTLQKIIDEIPSSFLDDFTDIVISFQNISIDVILSTINHVKKTTPNNLAQSVFEICNFMSKCSWCNESEKYNCVNERT